MTDPYVFISYSRRDNDFVNQLSYDLNKAGIAVWRDIENIQPGANWQQEIQKYLLQATVLLYIVSENSAKSFWIQNELRAVLNRKIKIIPIILDDIGAHSLPTILKEIQWVDFRDDYHKAFELLKEILHFLRKENPESSPERKSKGYVFLSYAEEDTQFVSSLKKFFAKKGYAYWDYQESDRDYHRDLYLELEGVISEAKGTLSILSPAWKLSQTAIKEFHFSVEVGVPVFLIKAREMGPTLVIAGIPYIDFTQDMEEGFNKLDKELKRKKL